MLMIYSTGDAQAIALVMEHALLVAGVLIAAIIPSEPVWVHQHKMRREYESRQALQRNRGRQKK